MFITGLHDPIQKEIMKLACAKFQAVYEATLDLEVIQQDNKIAKPMTVATVREASPATCEYKDNNIKAINAICACQGQAPLFHPTNGGTSDGSYSSNRTNGVENVCEM
jgi:hypothetical protein